MNRQSLGAGPLVAVIAGFGIAACGGSSTGTPTPTPTPTPASINNAGGSFCSQAAADAAQLRALSTGLATSPGAVPTLESFKHLISSVDQAIDSLDSAAPSEIASDFHAVRAAYDQLNTQVQSATTLQQIGTAASSLSAPALKTSLTNVGNYFNNTCHLGATSTTTT